MSVRERSRWIALVLLVAPAGCGRSTEDLCEDFVEECGEHNSVDACVERAGEVERQAEELGCLGPFDAYLDCVDGLTSLCHAADACELPKEDLERCGVVFP